MVVCASCGSRMGEGARFCAQCGVPRPVAVETAAPTPRANSLLARTAPRTSEAEPSWAAATEPPAPAHPTAGLVGRRTRPARRPGEPASDAHPSTPFSPLLSVDPAPPPRPAGGGWTLLRRGGLR